MTSAFVVSISIHFYNKGLQNTMIVVLLEKNRHNTIFGALHIFYYILSTETVHIFIIHLAISTIIQHKLDMVYYIW